MKKFIAVIAFFAITLSASTSAFAQEARTRSFSNEAKVFTHKLVQEFNITKDQQNAINAAFMYKQRRTKGINANSPKNEKKVINMEFDNKLKSILTEVQYQKYSRSKN